MTAADRFCAFTIVAQNYLAYAEVLMASVRRAMPDAARYVLVVDSVEPNAHECFETLSPYDVLDSATFERMAFSYDVTELSTAVKPAVMTHLLTLGHRKVAYFDPDIVVMRAPLEIVSALDDADIVLTPHATQPIPQDGKAPNEITLLQAGTYNLGFIAVRESANARTFLAWWHERLETMSVVDVTAGLFTDQKWINLVPGMFPGVRVLRGRGLNVAYWNLHERRIDEEHPETLRGGEPITFFHFSGFDPRQPSKLSKYQDRIVVEDEPGLAALLRRYAVDLIDAGYEERLRTPYGLMRFSNGVRCDTFTRAACRDARSRGLWFSSMSDASAADSFYAWLNAPAAGTPTGDPPYFTNYLAKLYELRKDLHRSFPDPAGADRIAFHTWLRDDLDRTANAELAREAAVRSELRVARFSQGVTAIGYFKAESGTGEAGRGVAAAIGSLGVPLQLIDVSHTTVLRANDETLQQPATADAGHFATVTIVNADEAPRVRALVGPKMYADAYNVGVWYWELSTFPERWSDRFNAFDEIWVGSTFVRDAIAARTRLPVVRVPPVVRIPYACEPRREAFGFADGEFVFLFMFDFHSIFERKNPLAVVRAFERAFPGGERVRLVVKFSNSQIDPRNRALLDRAAAKDARVELIDRYVTADEKNALLASCDAYVSLHRSEGFGLTLAEAMALGKPVIATNWSGNVDFLTEHNGYPVGYTLNPLRHDVGPYERGALWADADLEEAAAAMRVVAQRPLDARARGAAAAADIATYFSPGAIGDIAASRLGVAAHAIARRRAEGVRVLR